LAKAVAPNEVIHVSSRDVSSIFKIQASAALQGHAKSGLEEIKVIEKKPGEIKKKLDKYQQELEMEIKMQEAAEKILLMTKETQRHTVMAQLEASGKRIHSLRAHVNAYSAALNGNPEIEKDLVFLVAEWIGNILTVKAQREWGHCSQGKYIQSEKRFRATTGC
jgi:hypothetical protein